MEEEAEKVLSSQCFTLSGTEGSNEKIGNRDKEKKKTLSLH